MLAMKGYETLLPLYVEQRRWSDRIKALHRPLIPNYVFCHVTDDAIGPVVTTPRVVRMVGAGRSPIQVYAHEIEALRRIDANRLRAEPWPFAHIGQTVELRDGPLSGIRGVLVRIKGEHRLVVSVTLLQRSVAVEVEAQAVVAVIGDRVA